MSAEIMAIGVMDDLIRGGYPVEDKAAFLKRWTRICEEFIRKKANQSGKV